MLKHATRNIFISRIVRPYRYKLFDVRIKLGLTPLNAVSTFRCIHLSHFRPAVEGPNPTTYKSIHSEQNLTWPLSQINHLIIECSREFAGPSWHNPPNKYEITDPSVKFFFRIENNRRFKYSLGSSFSIGRQFCWKSIICSSIQEKFKYNY